MKDLFLLIYRQFIGNLSALYTTWVESGFITIVNPSLKARKYAFAAQYHDLLDL